MFDSIPVALVIYLAAFVAGMVGGRLVYMAIRDRRPEEKVSLYMGHEAIAREIEMFCRDCGKTLVSLRTQDGFDPKTGEPVLSYTRACSSAGTAGGNRHWPYCGHRVRVAAAANAHNHPGDETVLTCPVCLDVMVQNAGLDPKDAVELYQKSGVQSTYDSDMWLSSSGGNLIPNSIAATLTGSVNAYRNK